MQEYFPPFADFFFLFLFLSPSLHLSYFTISLFLYPSSRLRIRRACPRKRDLNIAARRRSALAIEIYLAEIVDRLTRGDGARYNTLFVLRPYISLRRRIASAVDEILILNMGRISPRIVIFRPTLRGPARVLHRASSDPVDFLSMFFFFLPPGAHSHSRSNTSRDERVSFAN